MNWLPIPSWGVPVTIGGAVIGLAPLIFYGALLWPGVSGMRKSPFGYFSVLLPLVGGWCYGVLLLMCGGGLALAVTDLTVWGASFTGDLALVWGVGGQAGDTVARGQAQYLTNGGHAMVLLLTCAVAAMFKRKKMDRVMVGSGILSGVLLGLTTGVLGLAAVPLASAVNVVGSLISTTIGA